MPYEKGSPSINTLYIIYRKSDGGRYFPAVFDMRNRAKGKAVNIIFTEFKVDSKEIEHFNSRSSSFNINVGIYQIHFLLLYNV